MAMSSTIQVLKVNPLEKKTSKKTGNDYEIHTAECIVLDDDGGIECVGVLRIAPALRDMVRVGTFRAGFSLRVPTYGDNKGEITSMLTSLMPVPVKAGSVPPAASKSGAAA